jgi:hypothetical protein
MRVLGTARRIAMLLASAALLLGLAAAPAAAAPAAAGTGWIRLAHLSPNTPAIDVYLYSFGDPSARIVLHHVTYGTASPYEAVAQGQYTIAMRPAGAAAASPPVLSASVTIAAGHAYMAAALGLRSALRLQVFGNDLTTPAGKALVRVIQASLKQHVITVSWDGQVIVSRLPFAAVTSYQAVAPGTEKVSLSVGAGGGNTASGDAGSTVALGAGTIHTLVVLDGPGGLEIANLEDAAGSARAPAGGAATGLGGTARRGPGSPVPWLVVIGAGSLLATASGLRLRRGRRGRRGRQLRAGA